MHHRAIEMFNLPNLPFADRAILVFREFNQLLSVRTSPEYASTLVAENPKNSKANDFWKMFSFV